MVEKIYWPYKMNEPATPFTRVLPGEDKKQRPLRLTFHTESLSDLSATEQEALRALYELSNLPIVDALQTEPGQFPHIEIAPFDDNAAHLDVIVNFEDGGYHKSGIDNPSRLPRIAASIVGQSIEHPDVQDMFDGLIIAEAHSAFSRDILVTASRLLIEHRSDTWLREVNPCTPSEAAQILGLFLRSHSIRATHLNINIGRRDFYWVLARTQLKGMWRYNSACGQAGKVRSDNTQGLGASILIRCSRALQACDSIGELFYSSQGRDTSDRIMYHFDYLTLLLVAAFDAQARIAYRAYRPKKPRHEWYGDVSFRFNQGRERDFHKALKACGANELYTLIWEDDFQALLTILYELRNKIHGSALGTYEVRDVTDVNALLANIPLELVAKIWTAAETIDAPDRWGLDLNATWQIGGQPSDIPDNVESLMERLGMLLEPDPPFPDAYPSYTLSLEPYAFSLALVKKCFEFINLVAEATDVTRLFDGHPIPPLKNEMPEDAIFSDYTRNRIAVLGGIPIE
jgi:hypothetical protein